MLISKTVISNHPSIGQDILSDEKFYFTFKQQDQSPEFRNSDRNYMNEQFITNCPNHSSLELIVNSLLDGEQQTESKLK